MNSKPILGRVRPVTSVIAATLSTVIAIAVLSGVIALFQSRGVPMERLAAAERACAAHAFVSERNRCMSDWITASQAQTVAGK